MLKIAHLITDLDIGGSEMMLCRLISNMSADFKNIIISMANKGPIGLQMESRGVKIYALNSRGGKLSPFALLRLIRILIREKPRILQTWLYHADFFGLLAAKIAGIRIVIWNIRCSHSTNKFSLSGKMLLKILAGLSKMPQVVISNSTAGMNAHKKIGYRPRKWEIINNGFELDKFYPKLQKKSEFKEKYFADRNSIIIGSVARFNPLKDHENFLRGVKVFDDKYQKIANVKFVFIGKGMTSNKILSGMIKSLDIGNKLIFIDERSDIVDIISGFDIYCSSSHSEGFPNTIGESMACGVPCVATNAGDSEFLIGDTGIIVHIKDPEALAAAWHKMILIGREERKKLGAMARKRIESLFSIDRATIQYEELYTRLIGSDI